MEPMLEWIHGLPAWMQIMMLVVASCKVITMLTPTKVDDIWFGKLTPLINTILKAMNVGGLNMLFDKNADDKSK
jgi:hypothetical protein